MKNVLIVLMGVSCWVMAGIANAHAFYVQDSVEFSDPRNSPYPNVPSDPIEVLPQGSSTINVGEETYYYSGGIFYQRIMRDQKYVMVPPPIGAIVFDIPQGYQVIFIDGKTYYVLQGIYYKRVLEGYKVIYPPS